MVSMRAKKTGHRVQTGDHLPPGSCRTAFSALRQQDTRGKPVMTAGKLPRIPGSDDCGNNPRTFAKKAPEILGA